MSGLSGSNCWPLMSHSVSGSAFELPRWSSNVGMHLSLIAATAPGTMSGTWRRLTLSRSDCFRTSMPGRL